MPARPGNNHACEISENQYWLNAVKKFRDAAAIRGRNAQHPRGIHMVEAATPRRPRWVFLRQALRRCFPFKALLAVRWEFELAISPR